MTLPETRRVVQESLLLEPELAQAVSLECEGDPLAAGQLLREWASRKLPVVTAAGTYTLPPSVTPEQAFPPDQDSLVRRRVQAALDNCADPQSASETLAAIALAGQEPPAALIRSVNDAGLDALLATGLVSEQRGYLVFEHSRIYQKALEMAETLPNARAVHGRIADAWEALGASTGLDVALPLGLHRLRSGEPDRAVGPLLSAAANMNQGGRRDAIRAAAMAIEAADAVGQPTARLEARRLHAEALLEAGHPERAMPLIENALREVEGDRLARARLRVLLARAMRKQGDLDRAHRELEQARNVFAALRDRAGLIEVALQKARLARVEGRSDNAVAHWGEVLRMNRGDLSMESEALTGLCEALIRSGKLEGIERQLERLQSVARTSGDTRRIAESTATVGILYLERQDYEQARLHLTSAGAIAATLGADALHLRCRTLLADVQRRAGELESAEETSRWVVRFAGERAQSAIVAHARVQLAFIELARGESRRVRAETEGAAEALQQSPRHGLWLQIGVLRAMLAAEAADERMCRAWFAVAQERGLGVVRNVDLASPLERLMAAAGRNGWTDVVRRVEARLASEGVDAAAPPIPAAASAASPLLPEPASAEAAPVPSARADLLAGAPPPALDSGAFGPRGSTSGEGESTPLFELSDPRITAPRPRAPTPEPDPGQTAPMARRLRPIRSIVQFGEPVESAPVPLGETRAEPLTPVELPAVETSAPGSSDEEDREELMIEAILDELVEPLDEALLQPLGDGPTHGEPVLSTPARPDEPSLDLVELDASAMVPLDPPADGRIRLFTKRAWVRSGVVLAVVDPAPGSLPEDDPRTEPVVPGAARKR